MCNQGKTIKLCTCEVIEETSVNSWQLLCGSTQQSIMGVMLEHRGGFIEFNHKDYIHEKIVEDLNTGDAFDFDYNPERGDMIIISLREETYYCLYEFGKFVTISASIVSRDGTLARAGTLKLSNVK